MNHPKEHDAENEYGQEEVHVKEPAATEDPEIIVDDLQKEEEEIRELENKKRGLEDRVSGMERDLGGLLR